MASEEIIAHGEKVTVTCLNCGTQCDDRFCPHCGQSTATPAKLKMRNFGKGLIMSFGRLTPGFLTTLKGLMFKPWDVIRDHIHGRHVRYSPPFTMVIQVFLYATIIYAFVDSVFGTEITDIYKFDEGMLGYGKAEDENNILLKLLDQSVVVQALVLGIPICFIVYLAYIRAGSRKFNFAEYLAAFVYMFAAVTIYDIIFNLIYIIPGIEIDISNLTVVIAFIFSFIILWKAFPQDKWWKSVALFVWMMVLALLAIGVISAIIVMSMNNPFK